MDGQDDDDLLRLPIWFSNTKLDTLTAEEWIEGFQRAKEILGWNDETALSRLENYLGGKALAWYHLQVNTIEHTVSSFFSVYSYNTIIHNCYLDQFFAHLEYV